MMDMKSWNHTVVNRDDHATAVANVPISQVVHALIDALDQVYCEGFLTSDYVCDGW